MQDFKGGALREPGFDLQSRFCRCPMIDTKAKTRRGKAERVLARRMMGRIAAGADVRAAKAKRLRRAVREKTYENALKLEVAVDRLLESLG